MRRRFNSEFDPNQPEDQYRIAAHKVKRIKGFYSHLMVYICVNILIVFINISELEPGESYFKMENFITASFWGIWVVVHGLRVFGYISFFSSHWEERKIKEFMEKENTNKWE